MSSLALAGIVFSCVIVSSLAALIGKRLLPESHFGADSKEVLKLTMGVIATLSALVLGLLIATAKETFDAQSKAIQELSANVILLDRVLARFGPEAKSARDSLKQAAEATMHCMWSDNGNGRAKGDNSDAKAVMETMYDKVAGLEPRDDAQTVQKTRAVEIATDLARANLRLLSRRDSPLSGPFLIVLVCWLVVMFAGYGLMAPRNPTIIVVLIVCALSISGAILLLRELDTPFSGLMQVSSVPLHDAVAQLGH